MGLLRVVSYNIQFGLGRDRRIDLARIARTVEPADVIALQEVETAWKRSGEVDQAAALAALLPRHHWVYGPGFDVEASRVRADGTVEHRRRRFGGMVLARTPILSTRVFPLRKLDPPRLGGMQTAVLEAVVRFGACALRIYDVHLDDLLARTRLMQIEELMAIVATAPAQGGVMSGDLDPHDRYADENWSNGEPNPPMPAPAIVMGDFNAPPDGPEYDALVGPRDARQGRVVVPDRLVDALPGGPPTWRGDPARTAEAPARIDYVFVTPDLAPAVSRAWVDEDADGSDHQPVWVELAL